MQCRNCGIQLAPGTTVCPNCRAATPYASGQPANSLVDPTVLGTPYQQFSVPPTAYGTPPPPAQNPYGYSESAQPSPYQSSPQNPYNYGTPPAQQPAPYAQPANAYQYNNAGPAAYTPQLPPVPFSPSQPRKKSNMGVWIAAVIVVLLVASGATYVFLSKTHTGSPQSSSTQPTAVPQTPSGLKVDTLAAGIITDIQTADGADATTAEAQNPTKTFKVATDIYVTFHLNNDNFDFTKKTGYVNVKFYSGKRLIGTLDPLQVDHVAPGGYFKAQYTTATTEGSAELYWCLQSNCSDAKLAQVTTFTVTN